MSFTVQTEAAARARPDLRGLLLRYAALVGLLVLVLLAALLSPHFLSWLNLFNILRQWSMVGLIAVGLTFVIIAGGIDLSGGALVAMCAVIGAVLVPVLGPALGLLAVLLAGLAAGGVSGAVITWGGVPPFIATLGMMTIARGIALFLSDGRTLPVTLPPALRFWLGQGYFGVVPAPVILAAGVFVAAGLVLRLTPYGRSVAFVGDNAAAAHRCGIDVARVRRSVYALHGVLAACAGLLFIGRLGVGDPTAGLLFELSGIAAVVIGGTPFTGGTGSIAATAIGLLVIGVTYNILNLLSVSPYAQDIARGVIIVVAVLIGVRRGGLLR